MGIKIKYSFLFLVPDRQARPHQGAIFFLCFGNPSWVKVDFDNAFLCHFPIL